MRNVLRIVLALLLIPSLCSAGALQYKDEGSLLGYISSLDIVGAGADGTVSGILGTLTIDIEGVGNGLFLRLDVANELDLSQGNEFHWDTNTHWSRVSENEYRFTINGVLVHTFLVAGVADRLLLEDGGLMLLETGDNILLE